MSPINGMTHAASALYYWERRQEIVANNLANADTHGFKAERVFARMLEDGRPVADSATDLRSGSLRATHEPLDFALGGDGFFVVETPNGERLTRGGSFRLDQSNRIVDASGNPLLGEGGPITVAGGSVTVEQNGRVLVDGKEAGRIRVERVPAGTEMPHEAGTLFVPDGVARTALEAERRQVKQGHLEDSNVSTIGSMVDMISIQRAYAAVQKAVTTLDEVRGTITTQIGKPV